MTRYAAIFLSLLLFAMPPTSAGDIDRYLESTTAVVAHVNVAELDVPAVLEFAQAQFPETLSDQSRAVVQGLVGGMVQSLREAGVTRVYATLSTLELTNGQIAVIVPAQNPEPLVARLEEIAAMLPGSLGYKVHASQDAVLVTTEPVWKRLSHAPAANRTELSKAIENLTSETIGFACNVSDPLRAAVADVLPDSLPPSVSMKLSPKQLMEDIVSLQLTLHLAPDLQIQLAGVCTDSAGAQRTVAVVSELQKQLNIENLAIRATDKTAIATATRQQLEELIDDLKRQAAVMEQGNKLKRVINAVHTFESNYQHLPPRMTVSEQGQPLLSWRVFLLPYLGEQPLYNQFHLDEPWDSPHNLKLVERIPEVYRSLQFKDLPSGHTLIQLPLLPGAVWSGTEKRFLNFKDFHFKTSETLCLVVAPPEKGVIWTKPDDLELRPESLVEGLFGQRAMCHIALFDGAVRELPRTTEAARLRQLLTGAE